MEEHILKVAFYIAKWNYIGLPNEFEISKLLSNEVKIDEFNAVKDEIRRMLYEENRSSLKTSDTALKAYLDSKNKTITQARFEVNYILNKLKEKL